MMLAEPRYTFGCYLCDKWATYVHKTRNGMSDKQNKRQAWLKRIGFAGFLFFLIKGLIWLAIFYGAGKYLF